MDIVAKTSTQDITVQSINTINTTDDFLFDISILVQNKEKLDKFIRDLEILDSIIKVERIIK